MTKQDPCGLCLQGGGSLAQGRWWAIECRWLVALGRREPPRFKKGLELGPRPVLAQRARAGSGLLALRRRAGIQRACCCVLLVRDNGFNKLQSVDCALSPCPW